MSLVAVLDALIVILLGALVVLEILRPRRLRRLLDEVDQRTAEATAALDDVQRRLERSMEGMGSASEPSERDEAPARGEERRREPADRGQPPEGPRARQSPEPPGASRARQAPEPPEIDLGDPVKDQPQARELREKIAHLLESSGSDRTERERRLLHQLQETLERPAGSDRLEQERMLYRALEAATKEAGPRPGGEPPDEERELIAKLRRGG